MREILGDAGFLQFPSVCWLGSGDTALYAWCGAGIFAALVLIVGFVPLPCLVFLWSDYLSLTVAGQLFYQYQWDILLLEAGFMSIFLCAAGSAFGKACESSTFRTFPDDLVAVSTYFLFRRGQANEWRSRLGRWDCARIPLFHPAPSDSSCWFAQQLPVVWQMISVWTMFAIEVVLPFFLFAPRRIRLFGVGGIATLQLLIALTGNYGFFNLLTLLLCLMCVDDAVWRRLAPSRSRVNRPRVRPARFLPRKLFLRQRLRSFCSAWCRSQLPFVDPCLYSRR